MADHRRHYTELLPTVLWPSENCIDDEPYETPQGFFIPGSKFSYQELTRLQALVEQPNLLTVHLPLPLLKQLGRISFAAVSGCWNLHVYQDDKNRARYGQMSIQGIPNPSSLAHRTMYMVFYGIDSLPKKHLDFLDHLCLNKACCYPRHLERTTPKTNNLRALVRHGQMLDFEE